MTLKPLNLQLGWPTPSLHPSHQLLDAVNDILTSEESANALMYGPDPGYQPLRESTAKWLSEVYSTGPDSISPDRICITNGASASLQNILLRFTDPSYTRRIWMIEPAYFLACPIFDDVGYQGKLRGVPEDDEGLDINYLEQALEDIDAQVNGTTHMEGLATKSGPRFSKLYKHVIYTVPTFANPSGRTLSLRRRQELVRLARRFDALVVADDIYDVLRWPGDQQQPDTELGPAPPRLVDIDRVLDGGPMDKWGNCISNGSFGKIVGPGCRVGWVEGTEDFALSMSTLGSTRSGGAPSQLSSTFVHRLLKTGALQKHVAEICVPTYRARSYALLDAIQKYLVPRGVSISKASAQNVGKSNGIEKEATDSPDLGGFFIWVILPSDLPPAAELAAIALDRYKLRFAHGSMFQVSGDDGSAKRAQDGFGRGMRLAWSWHTEEDLVEGVERIAKVIDEVRGTFVKGI